MATSSYSAMAPSAAGSSFTGPMPFALLLISFASIFLARTAVRITLSIAHAPPYARRSSHHAVWAAYSVFASVSPRECALFLREIVRHPSIS